MAVSTFAYRGDVYLDDGVKGQVKVEYRFGGVPFRIARDDTAGADNPLLVGPADREIVFNDKVQAQPWSGCTTEKVLQIRTSLSLMNTNPKRIGLLKMRTVNGNVAQLETVGEFAVSFDSQPCGSH